MFSFYRSIREALAVEEMQRVVNAVVMDESYRGWMHYLVMQRIEQIQDSDEREKMANKFNRLMRIMDSFAYSESYRERVFSAFAEVLDGVDALVSKIVDTPEKLDHEVDPAKDSNIQ